MQNKKIGGRTIIIGLIVLILIGLVGSLGSMGWLDGKTSFLSSLNPFSQNSALESKPTLNDKLVQKSLITKKAGGVVRAIDDAGVVTILRVPPDAVENDVEVSLTPFNTNLNGLNYGVSIEPSSLTFNKAVVLSFNWSLAPDKAYQVRPHVIKYDPKTETFGANPTQRALVVKNYMPALVTSGGWYGVSDDTKIAISAAKNVIDDLSNTLTVLDAGLFLKKENKLSKSENTDLLKLVEEILNAEKPDLNELYLATMFDSKPDETAGFINQASAYGVVDGYLQLRCNVEGVTYEDAMIGFSIATEQGFSEVAETCKKRAEKLLIERANLVDRQKERPVIDAIEVLQQMQALGLDDAGSPGAAVAERLQNDIIATLEDVNRAPGQATEEGDGTVRARRASDDPLLKHASTLRTDAQLVPILRLLGINNFDEGGLKEFGERTHGQISDLISVTSELCAAMAGMDASIGQACEKIQNGQLQAGMDQWEIEVDEYAEGVDDIQNNRKPNDGWYDFSKVDPYLE